MNIRQLQQLEKQRVRMSGEKLQDIQNEIARQYQVVFKQQEANLARLYRQMGPVPSIQEAKRYNRLTQLKASIAEAYKTLTNKAIKTTAKSSEQQYVLAARSQQWSIEEQANTSVGWGILPEAAIKDSVLSDISGAVYSTRLKLYADITIDKTSQAITRALINGESFEKVASRLQDQFQNGYADAIRVVNTEASRNYSEGNLFATDKAVSLGIKTRKKWLSVIDDKTRPDHTAMDGVYADEDGVFTLPDGEHFLAPLVPAEGTGDPAQIIGCRCTYVDELVDMPQDLGKAREGSGTAPNYEAWLEEKGY